MTYSDNNRNRDPLPREPLNRDSRDPLDRATVGRELQEPSSGSFTGIALVLGVAAIVGAIAYAFSPRDNLGRTDAPATTASRATTAPATPPASAPSTTPSTTSSSPAR